MEHLKMVMSVLLIQAVLGVMSLAQTPGKACPDEQATDVPASHLKSTEYERCGLGVKLFGVGGAILGPKCYEYEVRTPAHQKCMGDLLEDHQCVVEGEVDEEVRYCECGGLVIPGIKTGIPIACVCGDWERLGRIEDFMTQKCP
jgi:hypothetical protein